MSLRFRWPILILSILGIAWLRTGSYRVEPGIGLDLEAGRAGLSLDAFDLGRPTLDAQASFRVDDSRRLILRAEDAARSSRAGLVGLSVSW